jgi:hypothetical protein
MRQEMKKIMQNKTNRKKESKQPSNQAGDIIESTANAPSNLPSIIHYHFCEPVWNPAPIIHPSIRPDASRANQRKRQNKTITTRKAGWIRLPAKCAVVVFRRL